MNQIPAVFLHTSTQLVTGLVVGTIVDGVFPEPCGAIRTGDWKAAVVVGAEIAGQLIVDGLVTVALLDSMRALPPSMQDSTMGATHSWVMMYSQPKLSRKMGNLGSYARELFAHVLGTAPSEIQLQKGAPHNRTTMNLSQKQVGNAYM